MALPDSAPLPDSTYLEVLAGDAAAIAALDPAGFDRPVAACPGWSVADTLEHLALVQRWAAEIVATRPADRIRRARERPAGTDLAAFAAESTAGLLATLRAADPDAETWTFTGPRPARWWWRRQAHESTVHRWDLQAATGTGGPIDPAVAVDGIDELLTVFVAPFFDAGTFASPGATIHVHTTDAEGEWLIRLGADGVEVTPEHAKGDVAARGSAADLLLALWGRIPADGLELFGDQALLERFIGAVPS